jgi:flagellar hook-associated protein 2
MATISFGGLGSNMDTDTIVASLVKVKQQQMITPLQSRIIQLQAKQTALATFQTVMANLKSTTKSLQTATFESRSASSSDSSLLSISSTDDDASAGTYSVKINSLATTDKVYFNGIADKSTTTLGTGVIEITSGDTTKTITIDATNNTLQGLADAINATSGINVKAAIVNDGTTPNPYRLVLTSNETGTDADIDYDFSALSLTEDAVLTTANDATDASVTVNALTVTQSDNDFDGVIPGVEFSIKDETEVGETVAVTVKQNFSSIISSLKTFISQYNSLATGYASQFKYSSSSKSLGPLGADSALQVSENRIKNLLFSNYNDLGASKYETLAQIGITIDKDGQLSLDEADLTTALEADAEEVATLFQGTATRDGLADKLYGYLDTLVNSANGLFVKKSDIFDDTIENLNDLITDRTNRISQYQARLKARFVALETTMSNLSSMKTSLENFSDQMSSLANRR